MRFINQCVCVVAVEALCVGLWSGAQESQKPASAPAPPVQMPAPTPNDNVTTA